MAKKNNAEKEYTSISKGGSYTVLVIGKGAGDELRGNELVAYQCNKTGEVFMRMYDSFKKRMKQI